MAAPPPTIHASAVLVGAMALLIRGPAGSGKSSLALALIGAGQTGALRFARLVADDRCHVEAHGGRLLVRPAAELAGLIEVRGVGIRTLPYEPVALIGSIVDLAASNAPRIPEDDRGREHLAGVSLLRLAIPPGADALGRLLAFLQHNPSD